VLCRQCSESREAFAHLREEAADRFLDRMLGVRDTLTLSKMQPQNFATALRTKNCGPLMKTGPVYNAAHEFCAFVYMLSG
jgi:hypothetical protein